MKHPESAFMPGDTVKRKKNQKPIYKNLQRKSKSIWRSSPSESEIKNMDDAYCKIAGKLELYEGKDKILEK